MLTTFCKRCGCEVSTKEVGKPSLSLQIFLLLVWWSPGIDQNNYCPRCLKWMSGIYTAIGVLLALLIIGVLFAALSSRL